MDEDEPGMTAFITLDAVRSVDQPLVGSKAFNCSRLRQARFPVPDRRTSTRSARVERFSFSCHSC